MRRSAWIRRMSRATRPLGGERLQAEPPAQREGGEGRGAGQGWRAEGPAQSVSRRIPGMMPPRSFVQPGLVPQRRSRWGCWLEAHHLDPWPASAASALSLPPTRRHRRPADPHPFFSIFLGSSISPSMLRSRDYFSCPGQERVREHWARFKSYSPCWPSHSGPESWDQWPSCSPSTSSPHLPRTGPQWDCPGPWGQVSPAGVCFSQLCTWVQPFPARVRSLSSESHLWSHDPPALSRP